MKRFFTLVATGLLVSALVACGSRNASVPISGPALSGAVPTVSQRNAARALAPDALAFPEAATASVLNTATLNGSPGFVARNGHTVYVFDGDLQTPNASTCLGACPVSWSPIPAAGATLSGLWGQFTRMNGSMQLSYATRPLYQFIGDDAAGQTNGDGLVAFGGTWHIAPTDVDSHASSGPGRSTNGRRVARQDPAVQSSL
jgi:predicted lipoprotein with Yx(FWY)xxD motif